MLPKAPSLEQLLYCQRYRVHRYLYPKLTFVLAAQITEFIVYDAKLDEDMIFNATDGFLFNLEIVYKKARIPTVAGLSRPFEIVIWADPGGNRP
jgi:hypothetical protein